MAEQAQPAKTASKRKPGSGIPFVATPEQREKVRLWAMVGTTQLVIAKELGISEDTLQRHFREELDEAVARGISNVAANLYSKAMAGDTASMIFYLKARAKWSEKPPVGDADNPLVIQTEADDESIKRIAQRLRASKLTKADKEQGADLV